VKLLNAWVFDDGGKPESIKGKGDCVVRAIAIAGQIRYEDVADALRPRCTELNRKAAAGKRKRLSGRSSVTGGVHKEVYHQWLLDQGWTWTPTMKIGQGCKVHLRADELPSGRLIARLSKHLCAVVDGVIHDIHDPSRDGTRCVYGYYSKKEVQP